MRSVLVLALTLALAGPAWARGSQLNVLVGTSVGQQAATTMSGVLWAKIVRDWVGENSIPFDGVPSIDDCHRAKALYMVAAPFDLKARLPGTPLHLNDRIAAQTHVMVTNCVTKQVIFDQLISLESNPVSSTNQGDLEPVASTTWESAIRDTLRQHTIVFSRIARVTRVSGQSIYIDADPRGLAIGQTLRIYAGNDGVLKDSPIILTIVDMSGRLIEARYAPNSGAIRAQSGDLVEPYAGAIPIK